MPAVMKYQNGGLERRKGVNVKATYYRKIILTKAMFQHKDIGCNKQAFVLLPKVINLIQSFTLFILLTSCTFSKQISKQVKKDFLSNSDLLSAHIGISIFEPSAKKFWYNHQAEKYFVPASNTKLFTLYTTMKYLGDSLPAATYTVFNDTLFILPTGDPTFLHRDFKNQRFFDYLIDLKKPVVILNTNWKETALGAGWSWDDYNDDYMAERSSFPIYGNTIQWLQIQGNNIQNSKEGNTVISKPPVSWKINYNIDTTGKGIFVKRNLTDNIFDILPDEEEKKEQEVPFITNGIKSAIQLLEDTLKVSVAKSSSKINKQFFTFYSQPSDSVYKIMMYRSDNFLAEQLLLMAANAKLGYMNDEKFVDTILNLDLKEIPQKPRWVDGSGLSHYNMFTPNDFIYILNKLKNEFGFERLKKILPTGGTGTLKTFYLQDSNFIYAKTGTLSSSSALSGFLITKKNKILLFSILANNFVNGATPIRRNTEKFLTWLRQRF